MKEEILTTRTRKTPPATNILNKSNYPKYSIWCSLVLTVLRVRYSKCKEGIPFDYKIFWVALLLIEGFGANDNITKKVIKIKAKETRNLKNISQGQNNI